MDATEALTYLKYLINKAMPEVVVIGDSATGAYIDLHLIDESVETIALATFNTRNAHTALSLRRLAHQIASNYYSRRSLELIDKAKRKR